MNSTMISLVAVLIAAEPPSPASIAVPAAEALRKVERFLCDSYMFSADEGRPDAVLRTTHAAALDRRFLDTVHDAERGRPAWRDVSWKRAWVTPREGVMLDLFPRSASYWDAPPESDFGNLLYAECVGWRQPQEPRVRYLVAGRRFALMDVFADDRISALELEPVADDCGGLECRVIVADGGRDRIWICPGLGYAMVRRVWQVDDSGDVTAEYRNADFVEVGPGLWLPRTCRCEFRYPPGSTRAARDYRLEVERIAVNGGVPDAMFEPRFPPGTRVYGADRRLRSSIPGGTDAMDLWAAVVAAEYPPAPPPEPGPSIAALACMTVGTGLLCFGCFASLSSSARIGPGRLSSAGAIRAAR